MNDKIETLRALAARLADLATTHRNNKTSNPTEALMEAGRSQAFIESARIVEVEADRLAADYRVEKEEHELAGRW